MRCTKQLLNKKFVKDRCKLDIFRRDINEKWEGRLSLKSLLLFADIQGILNSFLKKKFIFRKKKQQQKQKFRHP